MLESWQNLLNAPIDTSGYDQAMMHYRNLKNKMLDQITNSAKAKLQAGEYQKFINDVDSLILQNASGWGEGYQSAQQTLSAIEAAVADLIASGSTAGVQQILESIHKQVYDKKNKIKNAQQTFKQKLNLNKDLIFAELGIDNKFIENMIGVQGRSGDMSDIIAQASSYFIRYLYSQLFNEKSFAEGSRFKYAMSLGGYYKELHEYEALEKVLNNFLNIYHTGGTKVSGRDTEMDIFISAISNLEMGLNQNVEITQMISSLQEPPGIEDILASLSQQIDSFGEQVKSKSLGKSDTFEIGNRADLYSAFLSEGGNEYSSLQALHFLARFKNILLSLGVSNVLFSSNNKRQWMVDFIEDFRRQAYLLSFVRSTNKDKLTSKVGLEQLYTSSRNSIRSRFSK